MIKNYTLKIENINKSRLKTILDYLTNTKHRNHTKHNTAIFEYSNKEQFYKYSLDKLQMNSDNYQQRARGGVKLKVFAKSLTFNLPKKYKVDKNDCDRIYEALYERIVNFYKSFDYEIQVDDIYSVLHYQSNSHFHIILPYLDDNGIPLKFVKSKNFLNQLKLLWTDVVDNILGKSILDYEKDNNPQIKYLFELVDWYENLQAKNGENKYFKNQIIAIKRMIENGDIKIDRIENNKRKVVKQIKKEGKKLGSVPKMI